MTTTEISPLPSRQEMDDHQADDRPRPRVFRGSIDRDRDQLVRTPQQGDVVPVELGHRSRPGSIDVDPEELGGRVDAGNCSADLARDAAKVDGRRWRSGRKKEFIALGIERVQDELSQFMHGEQGAMMVAAKIVETVLDRRQVLRRHPDDGRGPPHEVFASTCTSSSARRTR